MCNCVTRLNLKQALQLVPNNSNRQNFFPLHFFFGSRKYLTRPTIKSGLNTEHDSKMHLASFRAINQSIESFSALLNFAADKSFNSKTYVQNASKMTLCQNTLCLQCITFGLQFHCTKTQLQNALSAVHCFWTAFKLNVLSNQKYF